MVFQPLHFTLNEEQAKNRFFIIPGSTGRSKYIAENFLDSCSLVVLTSSRGHDVYLGNIKDTEIKVGVVSTGMGCPSLDIIVTELIKLGVKSFVRVGTSGSLNINKAPLGSIVIATGAVRDESTSSNYVPKGFPSISNFELTKELQETAQQLNIKHSLGIVHTKDSLYSREFLNGPLSNESEKYMKVLEKSGVIASEMESSHLFVLGSIYAVKTATVLSVIGGGDDPFGLPDKDKQNVIHESIQVVIEMIKRIH